jgi:hypothetical protein
MIAGLLHLVDEIIFNDLWVTLFFNVKKDRYHVNRIEKVIQSNNVSSCITLLSNKTTIWKFFLSPLINTVTITNDYLMSWMFDSTENSSIWGKAAV